MVRWLEGASKQFTFNECLGIVFGKLHEQYIPAVNDYLKGLDEDKRNLEAVFACLEKKIWEFHPRIKRIRNCMELKRRTDEPIMDYDIRVKRTREAAQFDDLSKEQARILYVILTANDKSFTDECLRRVTNNILGLIPALLAEVWQYTHATSLNNPDNQSKVNNQKKQVNAVEKGKKGKAKKCGKCSRFHSGECKTKEGNKKCNHCTEIGANEGKATSHNDAQCWDLHPE